MSKAIFLEGDLKRHLINLAIPGIISLIVNFSFALADTYFVAQLGKDQLTAMSYTFVPNEVMVGLGLGLGIAIVACTGQSLGRKRFKQAKYFATVGTLLMVLIGLLLTIIGLCTMTPVFHALGASAAVMPYIKQFMAIWYSSIVFFLLYFAFAFTFRAYGYARSVMVIGVLSAIVNLAVDPVLIFGWFGIPAMGIAGAAWAGVIARIFTGALAVYWMIKRDTICCCWSLKRYVVYWRRLIKVGVPATLNNLIPSISTTVTTVLLASLSQEAVASYGIATRIQWIAVIPFLALSSAVSGVVAQNYGAQLYGRVISSLNITLVFSIIWGLFVAVCLAIFAVPFVDVFNQDAYVNHMAQVFLYIVPISYMGWGAVMMINAAFNSMNKPLFSTMITLMRLVVVFIPLAIITKQYWGYYGVFGSLSFANIIVAILAWLLVLKQFKNCR